MSHRIPVPPVNSLSFPKITAEGILWLDLVRSLSIDIRVATFSFNPISVAANTTVEQSVTIKGLKTNDVVLSIVKPSFSAGLAVGQGRVSFDDTLAITYINASSGAIDAGLESYTLVYIKNSRK